MELHRREDTKKIASTPRQSSSIFSSIARKFMHQEDTPRLTVAFSQSQPERCDLILSSSLPKKTSSLPLPITVQQSLSSPPLQQSLPPPLPQSLPPPSQSLPPQQSVSPPQSLLPPPPPQSLPPQQTPSPSSSRSLLPLPPESPPCQVPPTYSPPVDILQMPPKQQRAVPPPPPPMAFNTPSVTSPSPLTTLNTSPKDLASSPAPVATSPSPQDTPHRPLPFLTDLAAAAAARQKHIEEKASQLQSTSVAEQDHESISKHESISEHEPSPPKRAMPAGLLQEIANAGTSRLDRAAKAMNPVVQSPKGSIVNRAGTVRKAGTLGGGQRSERYGTEVLNSMRGESRGHLFVAEEGEKVTEKPVSRSGNPLLDEIRGFDFSKLRKVDRSPRPVEESPKHNKEGTPGLADLLRSRLEVMQTDSESDSSDSRFEFSD